jgi:hypothetical protein
MQCKLCGESLDALGWPANEWEFLRSRGWIEISEWWQAKGGNIWEKNSNQFTRYQAIIAELMVGRVRPGKVIQERRAYSDAEIEAMEAKCVTQWDRSALRHQKLKELILVDVLETCPACFQWKDGIQPPEILLRRPAPTLEQLAQQVAELKEGAK